MPTADRLDEVLDAAYACLTRYGMRRTTMDDIAGEMGMSRSAVYLYVRSKDDAFRKLAERLHARALARAREAAADGSAPYPERIHGVLAAKLDLVLALAGDSPHTAELLDSRARLFGDICHEFTHELRRLLTQLLTQLFAQSGTAPALEPVEAADICIALVLGLEQVRDGTELLRPATDALLAGVRAPSGASGRRQGRYSSSAPPPSSFSKTCSREGSWS